MTSVDTWRGLFDAPQRCVYSLDASCSSLPGASVDAWQLARKARNVAANNYETDYDQVANHFNGLHALKPELFGVAKRFASASGTRLASSGCNKYFCPRFA